MTATAIEWCYTVIHEIYKQATAAVAAKIEEKLCIKRNQETAVTRNICTFKPDI